MLQGETVNSSYKNKTGSTGQAGEAELLTTSIWMAGWVSMLHELGRDVDSLQLLLWGTGAASRILDVWTSEQNYIEKI